MYLHFDICVNDATTSLLKCPLLQACPTFQYLSRANNEGHVIYTIRNVQQNISPYTIAVVAIHISRDRCSYDIQWKVAIRAL